MALARRDFTEILIQRKVLDPEQVAEARTLAAQAGIWLQEAIVRLGYASPEEVISAIAEAHGLEFIDLTEV